MKGKMKKAMQENPLSGKDRIILPLDFPSFDEAQAVVEKLKNHVGLFKVGLTLYINEGRKFLEYLDRSVGPEKIFLDLKFHDIPETVKNVSSVVASISPVKFITVHASEGERILKAAVEALPKGTGVLGVTALTSLSEAELKELGISMTVKERVLKLAQMAKKAGCAGVVCSGLEARAVKAQCGLNFIVVTPGIRPAWARVASDDQRRVMTPGEAIQQGADYVVVGRPIYTSSDRVGAAMKVAAEIEEALTGPSK
jgi:orotidine-5'-phosphate decarboxylase